MKNSFIALDGEGVTRENNRHDYILFAASDGSSIHNLNDGGLSTTECLDYLLSVGERHKKSILVGFFTNYDVNMIMRDLSKEDLAKLRVNGQVTWRSPDNNKDYKIKYLPGRLFNVSIGMWIKDPQTNKYNWYSEKSVQWWDCSKFFQASFVSVLKSWKVTNQVVIDRIESMKDKRSIFKASDLARITLYCHEECDLLVAVMGKLAGLLADCGITITSWYGAGSVASALMRQNNVKEHLQIFPEIEPIALAAYYGGRVETFGVGYKDIPTYMYDIRSAYPSAIVTLPSLANAKWEHFDKNVKAKYSIQHVKWSYNKETARFFTPFPYRSKGHIFWPQNGEGWYHGIEVEAARKSGYNIKVLETWVLRPENNDKPFLWIKNIYELRQYYKSMDDEREKVLKYPMNSAYGKFAQSNTGRYDPPFQNYYYAGYITAYCRAKMMELMSNFNDGEVLSIATDGIVTTTTNDNIAVGEELGEFELKEVEPGMLIVQAGVYMTPTSIKHSRGFASKFMIYPVLATLWDKLKIGAEYVIEDTKFVGYTTALNMKDMSKWRQWVPATKHITFGGNGTKTPDWLDLSNDRSWIKLHPPTEIIGINEPYDPAAPELLRLKALFEGLEEGDDWYIGNDWEIK